MPYSKRAQFDEVFEYGVYAGGVPPFVPGGTFIGKLVPSPNFVFVEPGLRMATHWLTCPTTIPAAGPIVFGMFGAYMFNWAPAFRIRLTIAPFTVYCVVGVQTCIYDATAPYKRLYLAVEPFTP